MITTDTVGHRVPVTPVGPVRVTVVLTVGLVCRVLGLERTPGPTGQGETETGGRLQTKRSERDHETR